MLNAVAAMIGLVGAAATPASALAGQGPPRNGPRWAMGVIGDSISAATFADISINSTEPDEWDRFGEWLRSGFDSDFLLQNRDSLSWASGSRIRSHKVMLEESLARHRVPGASGGSLEAINVAVMNATAADAVKQARQLARKVRSDRYDGLLYVTYLVGANDACSDAGPTGTPRDQMRASVLAALTELSALGTPSQPVRVLMAAIPRIPDLARPAIRHHPTILGMKCSELREDVLNMCAPLFDWKTPEQYAARMRVVDEKNAVLQEVALEAHDRFPGLEVVFSDRFYSHDIDVRELAADCFHPGRTGQERLAQELWADQPWF